MTDVEIRKGMPPVNLSRGEFERQYKSRFVDPAISAGRFAEVDGYVVYMEPYATLHRVLDEDAEFRQEVQNVARALGNAVRLARSGHLQESGRGLADPNPK